MDDDGSGGRACLFILVYPIYCLFLVIFILMRADWGAIAYVAAAVVGCCLAYAASQKGVSRN